MGEQFMYNEKTHRLHIRGYCMHTRGTCTGFRSFDSEDEALAYDGRAVGMCKICQKERERRLEALRR